MVIVAAKGVAQTYSVFKNDEHICPNFPTVLNFPISPSTITFQQSVT